MAEQFLCRRPAPQKMPDRGEKILEREYLFSIEKPALPLFYQNVPKC